MALSKPTHFRDKVVREGLGERAKTGQAKGLLKRNLGDPEKGRCHINLRFNLRYD